MASPAPDASGPPPPSTSTYPSLQELCGDDGDDRLVSINRADLNRLYWTLDGPLETAITVMATPYYDPAAPPREPYARADAGGAGVATLHPVSMESITNPPVSSLAVGVQELFDWEDGWLEIHECHEGNDDDHDHDGAVDLLRCCGEDRPSDYDQLRLTVRAAGAGEFVTISDFVAQVHPWLMGMRAQLVAAATIAHGADGDPLPPDTQFMVVPHTSALSVVPEYMWVDECSERALAPYIVPFPEALPEPDLMRQDEWP